MNDKEKEPIVTPWEVSGELDYEKLIKKFGTSPLTEDLIEKLKNIDPNNELHIMLRRGLFFSHRDFDIILKEFEQNKNFVLYTGRGPSGHTHLGHLVPWIFTKYLQDIFDVPLYFQITDDEKFLHKKKLSLDETINFTYDNALDVAAVGFDPKKTFFISDVAHDEAFYRIALEVAKKTTFSTVKAVFGFENSTNIGMIFFPAMQAAPCFYPAYKEKNPELRVLIPAAIDQDPYWRISRDVAEKLGYKKPTAIHCKFFPGLAEGGKMSASIPDSAIFMVDTPKKARKKVMKAFTGGRTSVEEQRKLGGQYDICTVYWSLHFLFESDDEKLAERRQKCKSGELLCGECKKYLAEKVEPFLLEHQKRREEAKEYVKDMFLFLPEKFKEK